MKTEIEKLKEQYPELNYEDGYLYATPDDEGYLHDKGVPLDGKHLIEEFFENREMPENPNENNPEKENYIPVSGRRYIHYYYNGDYSEALKEVP